MNRKDYFLAVIAGFFTGLFVSLILRNLEIKSPGGSVVLLLGIPSLWILGLNLARFLQKKISWTYQFGKFFIVGSLNTSIDFGILNFGSYLSDIYSGVGIIFLNVLSSAFGITSSYLWNKYWTFSSGGKPRVLEAAKFMAVNLTAVAINTAIVFFITTFASLANGFSPPEVENIAKVIATAITLFWNFFGLKFFVFKK